MSEEKQDWPVIVRLYTKERDEKLKRLQTESGLSRQQIILRLIDSVESFVTTPVFLHRNFDRSKQPLDVSNENAL